MNNSFIGVVLTLNEELNIEKCLKKLNFLKKVFIIDSYSSDKTASISKKFKNVRIIRVNKKLDYVGKLNFIKNKFLHNWILVLDADYELSANTYLFLQRFKPSTNISGYRFNIINIENGYILDSKLYPSKSLLVNTRNVNIARDGHKEKIKVFGKTVYLKQKIYHNDKKNINIWIHNQFSYASKDAELILLTKSRLRIQDQIRRIPFLMNFASFFYYLFYKKLIFKGWPGIKYTIKRQPYEFFLSLWIIKKKIQKLF